jgi:hypothetical protein
VLLCHRVVLGVSAAGASNDGSAAAGGSSSSSAVGGSSSGSAEAAGKHQVAVMNSCLKLVNRLAVPSGQPGTASSPLLLTCV